GDQTIQRPHPPTTYTHRRRARGDRSTRSRRGGRPAGDAGKKDGEGSGADEGGGVLAVAVPAEGDAGAVEGHHHQDPPQGHRELDLRHAPPRPRRRHLPICDVVQGAGEAIPQILNERSSKLTATAAGFFMMDSIILQG
ncbi:hypothetical protein PAHAL_4G308200, partial [Panicum hallii]